MFQCSLNVSMQLRNRPSDIEFGKKIDLQTLNLAKKIDLQTLNLKKKDENWKRSTLITIKNNHNHNKNNNHNNHNDDDDNNNNIKNND